MIAGEEEWKVDTREHLERDEHTNLVLPHNPQRFLMFYSPFIVYYKEQSSWPGRTSRF